MEETNRGFGVLPAFKTRYHGDVRVQESSNAMGPHLWIFSDKNPIEGQEPPHFQLGLHEAKELRHRLTEMIKHLENSWDMTVEIDEDAHDVIHDLFYDTHGRIPTHQEIHDIAIALPKDVVVAGDAWGFQDTVVREHVLKVIKEWEFND